MDTDRRTYKVQQWWKEEWLTYWGEDEEARGEERLHGKGTYLKG